MIHEPFPRLLCRQNRFLSFTSTWSPRRIGRPALLREEVCFLNNDKVWHVNLRLKVLRKICENVWTFEWRLDLGMCHTISIDLPQHRNLSKIQITDQKCYSSQLSTKFVIFVTVQTAHARTRACSARCSIVYFWTISQDKPNFASGSALFSHSSIFASPSQGLWKTGKLDVFLEEFTPGKAFSSKNVFFDRSARSSFAKSEGVWVWNKVGLFEEMA